MHRGCVGVWLPLELPRYLRSSSHLLSNFLSGGTGPIPAFSRLMLARKDIWGYSPYILGLDLL